jgi:hypothetical protein
VEGRYESKNETAEELASRMKKIRDEAGAALKKAQERMKKYYDKKRVPAPDFKVGQRVYVEGTNVTTDRPSDKLADRRLGPYEILEKVGAAAYKLKMPGAQHPVFNEELLTPYKEPAPHRREKRPLPQIVEGEEEYEMEEILKSRKRGRGMQYLVKWKGYPHSENTWEPARHLTHAKKMLNEFNKRNTNVRATTTVPILKAGHWDYLIKRFTPTQESLPYPTQRFFNADTGDFEKVT